MDYKIINIPHNNYPDKDMLELLHDAYKERVAQNILFGCSAYTLEEYQEQTKNAIIFVAYDDVKPVASICVIPKKLGHYRFGHICYVAVSPQIKRCGVGSKLYGELSNYVKKDGAIFLTSTTATTAISSVNWHLKQGFKKFRFIHFPERNYDSFYFVKVLKWNPLTLFITLLRWPIYFLTWCYTKIKTIK